MSYMMSKVSQQKYHKPKVVNLQIQFSHVQDSNNNLYRKVRKLNNYRTTQKCMKTLDVVESLGVYNSQFQPTYRQMSEIIKQNKVKQDTSSIYLSYKQEQKKSKDQNNNKFNYMKNKYKNHRRWLQTKMKPAYTQRSSSKLLDDSPHKRKTSLINLVDSFTNINQNNCNHKERIYMKTSQGKRQKINANAYLSYIQQKAKNIQYNTIVNPQNNSFILTNITKQMKKIDYSLASIKRKMNTQQKVKKSPMNLLNSHERVDSCGPWDLSQTNKSQTLYV